MKQHLWSNPKLEWKGFEPVSYWFDHKIWDLPLIEKSADDGPDTPVTVGSVYQKLEGKELTEESRSFGGIDTEIETTDGLKLVLKGRDFNRRMLETMLRFRQDGINPFEVMLYYYDKDSCRQDPQNCFAFFVVHSGKIVRERLSFFDHHDSGFDPSVFAKPDHSDPTWFDEPEWDEAETRFWYRKFYSETHTGQLMVLRADEPTLYHYERPQSQDVARDLQVVTLVKMYRLLWVAVPLLAAIAFPSIREYMGVVAIMLVIDVLWRCWATRKLG